MFVFALILLVIGLVGLIVSLRLRSRLDPERDDRFGTTLGAGITGAAILVAGVILALGSFFTQDVGQSNVLRDWSGKIVGHQSEPGFHLKAPWVDTVTFDVRNQRVVYAGKSGEQSDNSGGEADGAQITVQDQDGVSSNLDIALRYSIKPDAVIDIYSEYATEENLQNRLIFNDVRSVVRSVPGTFTTLELLTKRDEVQATIREALEKKWAGEGIIVEDVALQEVRPPDSVVESYAAAQQAQINVSKEQANLEASEVSAQQKVVQAQAEADANQLLAASLTDPILRQRYLDTLKELAAKGNLVVVPEGFNGLVNVGK